MGIDKITDQQGYLVISNEGAVLAVSYFSADKCCPEALPKLCLGIHIRAVNITQHLSDFSGDSC